MSKTDTWMPIYIADYLADTRRLNVIQHGAYLLLLMEYWRHGPLPNDDRELMSIIQTDKKTWDKEIKTAVRRFFRVGDDGLLHQKRIDAERTRVSEISGKRRDARKQKPSKPATKDGQDADKTTSNGEQTGDKTTSNDDQTDDKTAAKEEHLQTHAGVAVQSQSQSQSQSQGSELCSGADAPPPPEPLTMRQVLWRDGIPIVRTLTGLPDGKVRTLLGSLLKSTNDDCARVYRVLREAHDLRPMDPVPWIKAACNDTRAKNRIADSMAGIYGVEPDGPPTIDMFATDGGTIQ